MPNLAGERGRVLAQGRITNNRDAVLPTRRNTDAPSVAIRADLRSAARGDGGADELKRTLDAFVGSGVDALRAKAVNDLPRRQREADDGALDAQMGNAPGPERDRQVAYQEAYYGVKTQSAYNTFDLDTRSAVDDALDKGATPAEVHDLIVERFTKFRDETLDVLPAGITAARTETVARLGALGQTIEQTTAARIRERTQADFVTTAQGNIATSLRAGQPVDFENYVSTFVQGGLSPADAKKNAVDAITAVALDRDDPRPELLTQLLASRQRVDIPADAFAPVGPVDGLEEPGNIDLTARTAVHNADGSISTVRSMSIEVDGREVLIPTVSPEGRALSEDQAVARYQETGEHLGIFASADAATAYAERLHEAQANAYGRRERATPSLSAAEQLQVQDRVTQAESIKSQVEREAHEDRRDDLIATWYPRALEGDVMDDEINAAVARRDLTPQEGVSLLGMTEGLRDTAANGHLDDDFFLDVQERIARGNPPSVAQVTQWQASGRFGTGRAARRAVIGLIGDLSAANRAGRGAGGGEGGGSAGLSGRQARAQNVTLSRGFLLGALDSAAGPEANMYQRSMRARAGIEFNRRVSEGEDPMTVAQKLVLSFQPHIERGTGANRQTTRQLPNGNAAPAPGSYIWSPN